MNGTESGVGKREAAEETGEGHFGSSRSVCAIGESNRQGFDGTGETVETVEISERIGAAGYVWLDELSDGIEAGCGCD